MMPEFEIQQRASTKNEWENMGKLAREALESVLGKEGADLEIALTKIYLLETNQGEPSWLEILTLSDDLRHSFYFNKTLIEAARMSRKSPILDQEEQKVVDQFGLRLRKAGLLFSQVPNSPRGFHRIK